MYSGVCWVDMHKLAERVELEELKKIGLLQGEVDQMMEVHMCVHVHLCSVVYTPDLLPLVNRVEIRSSTR